MAGDFNTQLEVDHDSSRSPSVPSSSRQPNIRDSYHSEIRALLEDYNLIDVWNKKYPTSTRGTFHRNSYSSRLDYIFAPEYLLPSISSIHILPEPLSDHCLVIMQVNAPVFERGPGYWRFDNSLLTQEEFVRDMRITITDALSQEFENPNTEWEWTKFKIREFTITYVVQRNRERRKLIRSLEKRLLQLAKNHDLTDSPDVIAEVKSTKRELAEIQQHQANKAIFKARARWTQLGEKSSAYFLGLEKRRSKDRNINKLKDEQGNILNNPTDILAYEKKYFSNIYTENPLQLEPVDQLQISQEDVPQVSISHRNVINLPFSPRDFHAALKQLNKNKSPGSDGITPEFYLAFWDLLETPYYESIMFSLAQGSLSQEQRTGIVTLIPKKTQDRLLLNNWRPITLLNTDFKIFSKALAFGLQSCIKDVVEDD